MERPLLRLAAPRPLPARALQGTGELLKHHEHALAAYRSRSIESLAVKDQEAIKALFADFEALLGPVGAAKALHLLAPRFFPLWDRDIAINNDCRLGRAGTNASRYWRFMEFSRDDCVALGGEAKRGTNLLKRLDEFNFCLARGWL